MAFIKSIEHPAAIAEKSERKRAAANGRPGAAT